MQSEFYVYTINDGTQSRRLVSPLNSEFAQAHGLVKEAIAGEFTGEQDSPETFNANPDFVRFLQWAVAKHVPQAPGFVQHAQEQQDGPVFIVNHRARLHGEEPQIEDVLGAVEVSAGKATNFKGSADYKTLNAHGFLHIDPWLYDKYMEELQAHAKANPANGQPTA